VRVDGVCVVATGADGGVLVEAEGLPKVTLDLPGYQRASPSDDGFELRFEVERRKPRRRAARGGRPFALRPAMHPVVLVALGGALGAVLRDLVRCAVDMRLFVVVGLLGGLKTLSTFSQDTVGLVHVRRGLYPATTPPALALTLVGGNRDGPHIRTTRNQTRHLAEPRVRGDVGCRTARTPSRTGRSWTPSRTRRVAQVG